MEKEALILEAVSTIALDMFTVDELVKMRIKPSKFKWKFNLNNVNIIPILELYEKDKIYKTIESTEFSKLLQDLLRETQLLFAYTGNPYNSKSIEELFSNLEGSTSDCSECEFGDVCPIKND